MAIPSLRDEATLRDAWLLERLATIVPIVMEAAGVDAWVLVAREYNEDPVVSTMLPATWMTARRRTILVFTDGGRSRHTISRYPVGDAFAAVWDPEEQPDQWAALSQFLDRVDPASIALNHSPTFALADGLSASEHENLMASLPGRLRERIVPGDGPAIGWLERRSPGEIARYPEACRLAHDVLGAGLSGEAITPGSTTTGDLEWWLRERVRSMGLQAWFHPSVSVQDHAVDRKVSSAAHSGREVISPGSLVHVDFGIVHLGLHTDQQQHAYVLAPGEGEAPPGLSEALRIGNDLQDVVLAEFAVGRSGNEILAAARSAAIDQGITPRIYAHPIGLHGHGAGPTIGLWDAQEGVPGPGDYPVHPDTAYSIELSVEAVVPEWGGQAVSIMLEEEAFFDGERIDWIDGRQTDLRLID